MLALAEEGVHVVLGAEVGDGVLRGDLARPGRWQPTEVSPEAYVHRFPDHSRPEDWRQILEQAEGAPMVNPHQLVRLCRDKLALQQQLVAHGVPMPDAATGTDMQAAVDDWGAAFLKPRHGSFGRGVQRCTGGALPHDDGWILQRAIRPPAGWAGWSVRVLTQRDPHRGWLVLAGALRRHREDPVVNHARGAEVVPAADHMPADAHHEMCRQAIQVSRILAELHPHAGELGIDFVIDPDMRPWVIEVNGKPQGRLSALASDDPARFREAQEDAVKRPLRLAAYLAEQATGEDHELSPDV